ncbi:DUF6221 family protein [Amycolatopsis sp. CFH S0078]|uniref:DUF6221 family protein n=1 Tax=Amycolatopsis sp. CFH S0078 TaxID=1644108 RepID=UPI00106E126D|nr:DUF6221 family protein [Amycolatopsis sp. CFH S0078]
MDDLIAFLHARLDEDEQAARDVPWDRNTQWWTESSPCRWGEPIVHTVWGHGGPIAVMHEDASGSDDHIVRHDPARVLRGVEAKRRMVAEFDEALKAGHDSYDLASVIAPMMAEEWSTHPDYREEWRL